MITGNCNMMGGACYIGNLSSCSCPLPIHDSPNDGVSGRGGGGAVHSSDLAQNMSLLAGLMWQWEEKGRSLDTVGTPFRSGITSLQCSKLNWHSSECFP